jgi:hypothetical protein
MPDKRFGVDKGNETVGTYRDENDGTFSPTQRARLEGWDSTGATWIKVGVSSTGAIQTTASTATQPVSGSVSISGTVPVTGTFYQATQPISGNVGITGSTVPVTGAFFQATQPVSGPLTDAQLRASTVPVSGNVGITGSTVPVTGTFWPGTQPISGNIGITGSTVPVTGTFFQATQPVSGSVSIAGSTVPVTGTFWQATQPVSGSISVAGSTIPVTGTFWQATQPVSGPLTDTQLRASAVPVSGTFFQATQPVSGNIGVTGSTVPVSQNGVWTVQIGNTPNTAAIKVDGSAVTQPVAELPSSTIATAVSSAAGAAITLSLASVAAQFHYLSLIQIIAYNTAARTGGATPVTVTTSNLTGTPAFTFGSAGAVGANEIQSFNPAVEVKSAVAATPTTIVCPATTSVIWRINVIYRAGA